MLAHLGATLLALTGVLIATAPAAHADYDVAAANGVSIELGKSLSGDLKSLKVVQTAATVQAPGAPTLCLVDAPFGINDNGDRFVTSFTLVCRWTDDNQLSTDVSGTHIQAIITRNGAAHSALFSCPLAGPQNFCIAQGVRNPALTGTYRGEALVRVFFPWGFIEGYFVTVETITL
jgi:hypothetical protein